MNTFKTLGLLFVVVALAYGDEDCVCRKCQYALASKMISLNGDFITPDQAVRMIDVAGGKYVNGTDLHEIMQYFKANSDQFITTAQINQILAANTKINTVLGSSNATLQFMRLAFNISMNFISADKATLDEAIAASKAAGDNFDTQKQVVCRTIFTLLTPEKRVQLSEAFIAHISTDKRADIIAALTPIMKMDGIDTNVPESTDGPVF
uniref:Apolipophorin-III n=1 Tax=Panagrellus redivivus TaxID=6233 RepID=A0A7E4VL37_PANRE